MSQKHTPLKPLIIKKWAKSLDSNQYDIMIHELENGQSGDCVAQNVDERYSDLFAAALETSAERDRLKEINAELLEAAKKASDWISAVSAEYLGSSKYGRPWHKLFAAIAKAEMGK